ncbi:exosortase family protein XrtF [Flavobacterium silvisoli]|uniref:Exosortase family protein XrtF n=1 Tax=Flavobacterium silvisoli TaxID=2529433 RepID=A0A4Q9Z522_9FLAO|nr:exosortase family protein XrtF [Flavobacterium silvisoli]TBX69579.1 exosortase family protein XrtF [Flavobacterium silvisoli]
MKDLLLQYKPFLLFLGKFLLTYLVLTILYQAYLNRFDVAKSEVDTFTQWVAGQTETVLSWVDDQSFIMPHQSEPSVKLFYHNKYVSRIIEGCNAVSVMILFVAFVIAFTGKFRSTVLFVFFGIVLIHVLNVGRIALLSIALYHFPQYEQLLHGVVFPLIIYGVVFLLWVIWVNKFSLHAAAASKK